jgi:hypothetical protein
MILQSPHHSHNPHSDHNRLLAFPTHTAGHSHYHWNLTIIAQPSGFGSILPHHMISLLPASRHLNHPTYSYHAVQLPISYQTDIECITLGFRFSRARNWVGAAFIVMPKYNMDCEQTTELYLWVNYQFYGKVHHLKHTAHPSKQAES